MDIAGLAPGGRVGHGVFADPEAISRARHGLGQDLVPAMADIAHRNRGLAGDFKLHSLGRWRPQAEAKPAILCALGPEAIRDHDSVSSRAAMIAAP